MTEDQFENLVALTGHMDLAFNPGFEDTNTPCPHITWTGTITFGDVVYAITYEPTAPLENDGESLRFEEIWRIHDPADIEVEDGVATVCRGAGLVWGTDKGVGDPTAAHADGTVSFVDADGPFDEELVGRSTHWSGEYKQGQNGFSGPFHIN